MENYLDDLELILLEKRLEKTTDPKERNRILREIEQLQLEKYDERDRD